MSAPRLLDLFCGAGGATKGYQDAGFYVVGVDHVDQPNYVGDEFIREDVFSWWNFHTTRLEQFDAVHASPPCQRYIRGGNADRERHPDLLPPTRELLSELSVPWVIENVPGAPMRADLVLCGSMFGLPIRRHRWFEFSAGVPLFAPFACDHSRPVVGVYGHPHGESGAWPGMLPGSLESWRTALGIDWMTAPELADAIPPAYTQYIGEQLMARLDASAPVREATP